MFYIMVNVPKRYIPTTLTKRDKSKQRSMLKKSRKQYKKGKYFTRKKVKSFKSKISPHITKAKKIYNFDYQKCVVDTGNKISEIMGFNIEHNRIDFNLPTFEEDVCKVVKDWDWTIYQAIYRTKEIVDVKKSFKFIVNNNRVSLNLCKIIYRNPYTFRVIW